MGKLECLEELFAGRHSGQPPPPNRYLIGSMTTGYWSVQVRG
jgi:hypothetical protein